MRRRQTLPTDLRPSHVELDPLFKRLNLVSIPEIIAG